MYRSGKSKARPACAIQCCPKPLDCDSAVRFIATSQNYRKIHYGGSASGRNSKNDSIFGAWAVQKASKMGRLHPYHRPKLEKIALPGNPKPAKDIQKGQLFS
jgi:hypothetical protein